MRRARRQSLSARPTDLEVWFLETGHELDPGTGLEKDMERARALWSRYGAWVTKHMIAESENKHTSWWYRRPWGFYVFDRGLKGIPEDEREYLVEQNLLTPNEEAFLKKEMEDHANSAN